jgi:hypothetical protein
VLVGACSSSVLAHMSQTFFWGAKLQIRGKKIRKILEIFLLLVKIRKEY